MMEIDTRQLRLAALAYDGQDATGQSLAKTLICIADYIDRLKAELEASTDNYSSLYKEWADSQKQLAEARGESERLNKDLGWANKQIQLKDLELDQAIVQIEISSDIVRQEAARSILQIISMETMDRPFEQSQAVEIIRAKFKLEG